MIRHPASPPRSVVLARSGAPLVRIARNALAAIAISAMGLSVPDLVRADTPPVIEAGQAAVTGFSGAITTDAGAAPVKTGDGGTEGDEGSAEPSAGLAIDPEGAALRILDLGGTSAGADNRSRGAREVFAVSARDIGQVFGVTFDAPRKTKSGATTANAYAAASSVYGLQIVRPRKDGGWPERVASGGAGVRWMDNLWGELPGGGPGTIWRLDGETGKVEALTDIRASGQPNSGPGLGNITFDPVSKHLFVSDLDTGLIHRLKLDGEEVAVFDHGVAGRPEAKLEEMPDDPDDRADVRSEAFRADDPGTWGYALPPRRVWGLGVHAGRLYYSVAEGPEVWSVELDKDGTFGDARREFILPETIEPWEISDITFTAKGVMVLAQRPPVTGNQDLVSLAAPSPARVLRYERVDGSWQPIPDEYAIGAIPEHVASAGGIAIGYDYAAGGEGALDIAACGEYLWSTGDNLKDTATGLQTAGSRDDVQGFISGLQGNSLEAVRPDNVPPLKARFADWDGRYPAYETRGHMGDVAVLRVPCAGGYKPSYQVTSSAPCPGCETSPNTGPPGLDVAKRAVGTCRRGGLCRFELVYTNRGDKAWTGPLTVVDTLDVPGASLVAFGPGGWICAQSGARTSCYLPDAMLRPGLSLTLSITFRVPTVFAASTLRNCAWIVGLGDGAPDDATIWAVELELGRLGYYGGGADGVVDPELQDSIRQYQRDRGLAETGVIGRELVDALFGAGAWSDKGRRIGDTSCADHSLASVVAAGPVYVPLAAKSTVRTPTPDLVADPGPRCRRGTQWDGVECVASCPEGTYGYHGKCLPSCTGGQVFNGESCACTSGKYWDADEARCVIAWAPPPTTRCVANQVRDSDGDCACPAGTRWSNYNGWCMARGNPTWCGPQRAFVPRLGRCVLIAEQPRDVCRFGRWNAAGMCVVDRTCRRGMVADGRGGCRCPGNRVWFQGACYNPGAAIPVVGLIRPPRRDWTLIPAFPTDRHPRDVTGTVVIGDGPGHRGCPPPSVRRHGGCVLPTLHDPRPDLFVKRKLRRDLVRDRHLARSISHRPRLAAVNSADWWKQNGVAKPSKDAVDRVQRLVGEHRGNRTAKGDLDLGRVLGGERVREAKGLGAGGDGARHQSGIANLDKLGDRLRDSGRLAVGATAGAAAVAVRKAVLGRGNHRGPRSGLIDASASKKGAVVRGDGAKRSVVDKATIRRREIDKAPRRHVEKQTLKQKPRIETKPKEVRRQKLDTPRRVQRQTAVSKIRRHQQRVQRPRVQRQRVVRPQRARSRATVRRAVRPARVFRGGGGGRRRR